MFPSSSFYDSSSWEADSGSRSSSPDGRHGHGHRRKGRRNGRDNLIGHGEGGRGGMSRFGYSRESGWATGTASDSGTYSDEADFLRPKPVTKKHTRTFSGRGGLRAAAADMQGWRPSMEDAHNVILELAPDGEKGYSFFAVYDGHAGDQASLFCAVHLPRVLRKDPQLMAGDVRAAMVDTFLRVDELWAQETEGFSDEDDKWQGTTAVTALLHDGAIHVANAGDSRAVVSEGGVAVALSRDHKPRNKKERRRIEAVRGFFVEDNRVNGSLAMSRAIGDLDFKPLDDVTEQPVLAIPDVRKHVLSAETEFLILACDGIWDVMSNEEVVDYIGAALGTDMSLDRILGSLFDSCLADTNRTDIGTDNMTAVLVVFGDGDSSSGSGSGGGSSSSHGSGSYSGRSASSSGCGSISTGSGYAAGYSYASVSLAGGS